MDQIPDDDYVCVTDRDLLQDANKLARKIVMHLSRGEEWTDGTLDDTPYINRENMCEDIAQAFEACQKLQSILFKWFDGNTPEWDEMKCLKSYVPAENMQYT